jgi:hypothetical protein
VISEVAIVAPSIVPPLISAVVNNALLAVNAPTDVTPAETVKPPLPPTVNEPLVDVLPDTIRSVKIFNGFAINLLLPVNRPINNTFLIN